MNPRRDLLPLLKETYEEFQADEAGQLGAALAYYALFSLFPLLLLLIAGLGYVLRYWDEAIDVQQEILAAVSRNFSPQLSNALNQILSGIKNNAGSATIIGLITLLIGASSVFQQLDFSFNKIWHVPKPEQPVGIVASIINTIQKKLLSFGMVLAVGFLLLVSMALTGAAQALLNTFQDLPVVGGVAGFLIGIATTLLLNTLVFALLFKFLPDAPVRWGDVWLGAFVTAVLWEIGKYLLALYIGRSGESWSAYGLVGAVLILMAWIYFSSQILFLGAEFTKVYSRHYGSRAPKPAPEASPTSEAELPRAAARAPMPAAAPNHSVAAATSAGLLVGLLGGAVAALAALIIGTAKVFAPLTRRIRRER
ncbi:MAG TPA: YihY/virulence factor BrkB family protein [Roseiflexaceae bacterium]|nr:YihY/virulence factor BrkB family protein [Roseiflexaceae bacterium]